MNAWTLTGAAALALGGMLAQRPAQAEWAAPAQDPAQIEAQSALRAEIQAEVQGDAPLEGWRLFDMSVDHHRLSSGLPSWQNTTLRGLYRLGDHLWHGEVQHADRFGERGNYAGLQDTVRLAPTWHASLGYGLGDGVNWLPRYRVDAFLHHTWGAQNNWVTHLGVGEIRAPDEHRDRWGSLGLSAYMDHPTLGPWVAQGEVRRTRSDPGRVQTQQQFVALTLGTHRVTQLTWRHGWGREGWQALGDAQALVNFASRQDSLSLRHWITPEWGLRLMAEDYRNAQYRRRGWTFAVFREWP